MAYDPENVAVKTYVPKNNKLYQYPYNFMVFESPDGSNIELKFEDFKNNNEHKFITWLSVLPELETMCAPCDYEGPNNSFGGSNMNMRYALYCKAYPYCAVASDAFSAWWAQNKYSMPISGAVNTVMDVQTSLFQQMSTIGDKVENHLSGNKVMNKLFGEPQILRIPVGSIGKAATEIAQKGGVLGTGQVMSAAGNILDSDILKGAGGILEK